MPRLPHPLHPALVHFPIACWVLAFPCDLLARLQTDPHWAQRAYELIAAGVVLALPAMAAGLVEFGKLTDRPAATNTAYRHLALVSTAWLFYLASWALRFNASDTGTAIPRWGAVGLSGIGLITLTLGAWYGARLVYQHGIGQRR